MVLGYFLPFPTFNLESLDARDAAASTLDYITTTNLTMLDRYRYFLSNKRTNAPPITVVSAKLFEMAEK